MKSKKSILHIDTKRMEVFVRGKRIHIPRKEFQMLLEISGAPDRVISREYLIEKVWNHPHGVNVQTRTVDQHIARLRRRLIGRVNGIGGPTSHLFIETVAGGGYRLAPGI